MSAAVQSFPTPGGGCPFFVTCWATGPCTSLSVYGLSPSCQASVPRCYCCYTVVNSINVIIAGDSVALSFSSDCLPGAC